MILLWCRNTIGSLFTRVNNILCFYCLIWKWIWSTLSFFTVLRRWNFYWRGLMCLILIGFTNFIVSAFLPYLRFWKWLFNGFTLLIVELSFLVGVLFVSLLIIDVFFHFWKVLGRLFLNILLNNFFANSIFEVFLVNLFVNGGDLTFWRWCTFLLLLCFDGIVHLLILTLFFLLFLLAFYSISWIFGNNGQTLSPVLLMLTLSLVFVAHAYPLIFLNIYRWLAHHLRTGKRKILL